MNITCPRRRENGMEVAGPLIGSGPNLDSFEHRHGMAGSPRLPLCSYCGSLEPAELMAGLREDRYFLGPTDKSYKIYVHAENGSTRQYDPGGPELPSGPTIAKFYTQHLDHEQAWELHRMRVAGWLKFGYPGHFYRPIYLPGVIERLQTEGA